MGNTIEHLTLSPDVILDTKEDSIVAEEAKSERVQRLECTEHDSYELARIMDISRKISKLETRSKKL